MSTLYRFELNWYYARNPIVGEEIVLAVTDEGPVLNCFIDRDLVTVSLNNEIGNLCEIIDHSPLRNENGKSYHRLNVNDGAEWSVYIETDEVQIQCDGNNFYPFALKGFWEILHDMFQIPWSTIRKEYRAMKLPMEDEDRYVYVELDGVKHKPSDFHAPAEGPDGIDRWTSNGYGINMKYRTEMSQRSDSMLTLEQAIVIAKEYYYLVDSYEETADAYVFGAHKMENMLIGPRPPVVLKETGDVVRTHEMYFESDEFDTTIIQPWCFFDGTPVPEEEDEE